MAPKSQHQCTECGYTCPKWLGRCPDCGSWGSLELVTLAPTTSKGQRSTTQAGAQPLAPRSPAQRLPDITLSSRDITATGITELDRVLGQGLVAGSVILLAGEPGVGKSTLLLEVAARMAAGGNTVLYVTAEESASQVRLRAERTNSVHPSVYLAAESDLDTIFGHCEELKPGLLILDSVQTVQAADIDGVAGGVAQSRAVTAALTSYAKSSGIPVILVGHVTKDGNVAGPRVLEHLVDVVLNFEGDRYSPLRMLRGIKNRFGATDEVGCFEQTATGIAEVPDPSGLFLSHRESTPDGTAVTVAMDGVRPLLTEVQSLVVHSGNKGNPRRVVTGLDSGRVPMVLAVLEARAHLASSDKEVYIATVGGMTCREPAADLAVALATASAITGKPLPPKTIILGEVGLAGEIRRIPHIVHRLNEAQRLGFTHAIIPTGCLPDKHNYNGLEVEEISTLNDIIRRLFRGSSESKKGGRAKN